MLRKLERFLESTSNERILDEVTCPQPKALSKKMNLTTGLSWC